MTMNPSDTECIERKFVHRFQDKDDRDYIFKVPDPSTTKFCTSSSTSSTSSTSLKKTRHNYKSLGVSSTTSSSSSSSSGLNLLLASSFTIPNLPTIFNQGSMGACVANAAAYTIMVITNKSYMISRLYLYANCRCIDNTPLNADVGTTVRSACQAMAGYGTCNESVFPYIQNNLLIFPPLNVYKTASLFKSFRYTFVGQDANSLKTCLTVYKTPIIFGIMVYSSFMTTTVQKTGIVPMPNTQTETLLGGHCVSLVGYDDSKQTYLCANWWGTTWGNNGFFTLPYQYVLNSSLASDFCLLILQV